MKKILLFIVGLFGIFGTCFGAEYTIDFLNGTYTFHDNLGNTNRNASFSFLGQDSRSYCPGYTNISCATTLSVSGVSSDVFLTYICLPKGTDNYYRIFPLNTSLTYIISGNFYCFDFSSNPINLKDSGYLLFPISLANRRDFNAYAMGFLDSSAFFSTNTSSRTFSISFLSLISDLPDFVLNFNGQYYSNNKGLALPSLMTFYIPENPKFKINYGNTSTEYELTDNLSIYLKSPVVMSGITEYIYDGSTGINLFFNGTSQFYNKDELYLNTPSWYNNNIFTPICL